MSNKQARIKSMKNTTFESAMNSSSFASTESAAQKNVCSTYVKVTGKIKLYHDIWWWLEDYFYGSLSDKMYDVYIYYQLVEEFGKISVSENETECTITVGRNNKFTCHPDTDYGTVVNFIEVGIKDFLNQQKIRKDRSLAYFKKLVTRSYGKNLTDLKKERNIKLEIVLEAEQE